MRFPTQHNGDHMRQQFTAPGGSKAMVTAIPAATIAISYILRPSV
jgi:hypothetical protein